MERNIWKYKLDASSFLIYLYLSKCISNQNRKGFPSLRKMERILGLSRTGCFGSSTRAKERGIIATGIVCRC